MLAALALALAASGLAAVAIATGLGASSDQSDNSGNTFTSAASFCPSSSTGFLDPSADAAVSGGDNDGFELSPANAYADGSGYAGNIDGESDRHRFYDYNVAIVGNCAIKGIEVRLDWWLDSTNGTSSMSAELSSNGGSTWTAAYSDTVGSTTEHTGLLGGSTDTWGRSWTFDELSNANFRVRLTSNSTSASRDFYLDWVPLNVYYSAP
jgi:hypothetical protein